MKTIRPLFIPIAFVISWYVGLAFNHYYNQRLMWNDEECVFLSIRDFSTQQIFSQPLKALQVFPRAYLFAIQSLSKNFDFHLLSLRFLPFVCMMLGFFVWLRIAARQFKDRWEFFLFAASWPASITLIYYAAELKQYSMDVLAAALLILFLSHQKNLHEDPARRAQYYLTLAFLPAMALFSYPSVFFLVVVLFNLIVLDKKNKAPLMIYSGALAAFMAMAYHYDIRLRPLGTLTSAWGDYFIDTDSVAAFFKSLTEGINNLFSRWFIERPKSLKAIGRVFAIIGLINLFYSLRTIKEWKKGIFSIHAIAVFVFLEMIVAGALKKYPFVVPRTSLYFCPIVLFLIVNGMAAMKKFHPRVYVFVSGFYVIFLAVVSIGLAREILSGDLGAQSIIWK